jgi:L,D-transpeptidase YcbB
MPRCGQATAGFLLLQICRRSWIFFSRPSSGHTNLILDARTTGIDIRRRSILTKQCCAVREKPSKSRSVAVSSNLGSLMSIIQRSRLGASLLAVSFLALALCAPVRAENADEERDALRKKAAVAGKVVTQTEVVASKNVSPFISATSANSLQIIADRYSDIVSNGGFPKVPKGSYKKGANGKGTAALNKRLFMDGYLRQEAASGEFEALVTSATVDAVTRFQRNMGLAATGVVDNVTLAALNVPADVRLRTIQANIPRLAAYEQNLGDRYLVVNVPAQQIETVSNGRVFSRHNAIVGRPERPTPVVMAPLSDVNFNPYWNAPVSIVEKDIFPKLRSGTQILRDMNIRIFQGFGGPEVDPETVEWSSAIPDDYHFRQEPGPGNAMATAKINFSSPFGIYLHDTPEKQLFKNGSRFLSSGCVRVEKMDLLLEWVLNNQEGIGRSEIAALAETLERRDVKLTTPPQLRVAYLTAWPVGNTVAFRNDIYQLDGTGFTVGQPMPEGEVADDGQRFVLKPVPRVAGAVDAAEADGIGLFGSRLNKGARKGKATPSIYDAGVDDFSVENKSSKKPPALNSKKPVPPARLAAKPVVKTKLDEKKKLTDKKDTPGLFDWATYRKEQRLNAKKKPERVVKDTKKKLVVKKSETAVAVVAPKDKTLAAKKPTTDAKLVKKAMPDIAAKKPTDKVVKEAAKSCKPDAAGVVPKGCAAPVAKKVNVKKATATN